MSEYPEHEKMRAIRDDSEAIGQFLDTAGYTLCTLRTTTKCTAQSGPIMATYENPEWGAMGAPVVEKKWRCQDGRMIGHPGSNKPGVDGGECKHCGGTGRTELAWPQYESVSKTITQILADYFDIDLDKIEDEKRAMLDVCRQAAS